MNETKFWYFKNLFFFDLASDEEYRKLEVQSEFIKAPKDDFIYLPGEGTDTIFFMKRGFVKLGFYGDDGKEAVTNIIQPGEFFGFLAREEPTSPPEFAQALTDVALCMVNTERFMELLAQRADWSVQVVKLMGDRMHKVERRLQALAFKDARSRVVDFLNHFANEYGHISGGDIHVENFLTHQDIASLTATSRQLVSTVLAELREQGKIFYDRKTIVIHEQLAALR